MLIVMDRGATGEDVERVVAAAERLGLKAHPIPGAQRTAVGITGNKGVVTTAVFEALPGVLEASPARPGEGTIPMATISAKRASA